MRYEIRLALLLLLIVPVYFPAGLEAGQEEDGNKTSAAPTYNLTEAVERALEVNPSIKAAEHRISSAESEARMVRGRFFPDLTTSASYTDVSSIDSEGPADQDYLDQGISSYNIKLSQDLFAGLTVLSSYQKAKLKKIMSRAEKEKSEMELILQIQSHYLELLKAREEVKSLQKTVDRLQVNLEAAQAFVDADMAPALQLSQAKADLADARQRLSKARNERATRQVQLNILLDLPPMVSVEYRGRLKDFAVDTPSSMEQSLEYALDNRPQVRISRTALKMAREDVDIARGRLLPRLQADVGYYNRDTDYSESGTSITGTTYDRDQENTYWMSSLNLQWQFNTGGEEYYNRGKAEEEVKRLSQELKKARDEVETQVRVYYMRLKEARERINSTLSANRAAREGYQQAAERLEKMMGTLPEVLDSQARLRRAEANHNQALADYQLALFRLYNAMGKRVLGMR